MRIALAFALVPLVIVGLIVRLMIVNAPGPRTSCDVKTEPPNALIVELCDGYPPRPLGAAPVSILRVDDHGCPLVARLAGHVEAAVASPFVADDCRGEVTHLDAVAPGTPAEAPTRGP